jgi:hypothetical protein
VTLCVCRFDWVASTWEALIAFDQSGSLLDDLRCCLSSALGMTIVLDSFLSRALDRFESSRSESSPFKSCRIGSGKGCTPSKLSPDKSAKTQYIF